MGTIGHVVWFIARMKIRIQNTDIACSHVVIYMYMYIDNVYVLHIHSKHVWELKGGFVYDQNYHALVKCHSIDIIWLTAAFYE